jgi:hypothetical protein
MKHEKHHHHKEHHHGHKRTGDNLYGDGTGDRMNDKSKGNHTVHGSHLNNWKHEKPMHTEMGKNPKWMGK